MAVKYQAVIWNRSKYVYDAVLIACAVLYIFIFLKVAPQFQDVTRPVDGQTIRMQAFGTCAFLMLTVILAIGPLARLDRRFLPLLYNRRHFGVITCAVAFAHASAVLGWYFGFSPTPSYVGLLGANSSYGQLLGFPFEAFGILALFLLLVLAVTSHDFWLSFLTPPLWKAIHMSVYVAYAAIVAHIALGGLMSGTNMLLGVVVAASVGALVVLHLMAGWREWAHDGNAAVVAPEAPWLIAGRVDEIGNDRGKTVVLDGGERVAVFRYDGKLSAVTNLCAHQNGPLGEGRVIDGCITCPWHGFQYRPEDGCAPPPFTEKIATYNLKLDGDLILLDPRPNPPGTRVEPVHIGERGAAA